MSLNPLNDISRVYLENIAESSHLETDMKKRRKDNEEAIEDMKKTKAHKDMTKAARKALGIDEMVKGVDSQMRKAAAVERKEGDKPLSVSAGRQNADKMERDIKYMDKVTKKNKNIVGLVTKEAMDPVGQEDADIDNDGDTDKSDKYLHKRRKVIGNAIAKKKGMKEGFSNWRQDLSEVMSDIESDKQVKEKKVNNKVKINPKLGEAVEQIGGTLIEMVEIEGVLDDFADNEILLLSDSLIEEVVEEFFYECIEEGYDIEEVEELLIESLDTSEALLIEAKVTLGHDTKIKSDKLAKVKSAVKKVGKTIARGAGYAAGAAVRGAKAVGREFKSGYEKGRGSSQPSSSSSSTSSEKPKRPGLLSRIGSKLKSGLKKAVASGARSVSRGARNVARKMEGGESKKVELPKATKAKEPTPKEEGRPAKKRKSGPSYAQVKADIEKRETSKKSKKSDKLDSLLSSIRSEEVQIDEKTLTKMEMKKREEIVKSMKDKTADFEKRYPGRGKEVMYATATKMAKKIAEQMVDQPISDTSVDKKKEMLDKQKIANMKMLQQKQQMLQRQKLQMQKSGKLPLEAD